jgi:Uma2 family endonuclease
MATQPTGSLTYADLLEFPEDNLRRELIDGELIVTAAPAVRHQQVIVRLVAALFAHAQEHGGEVLPAPTDVFFSDSNVVEPDVVFVRADNLSKLEKRFVRSAPDIVIEISSPSTRRLELVRKKELYERFLVPEYWYVDLDADRVEVYRLGQSGYPIPEILERKDVLTSALVPGFSIAIDDQLGPSDAS